MTATTTAISAFTVTTTSGITMRELGKPMLDNGSSRPSVIFVHHAVNGHTRTTHFMMKLETFIVGVTVSIEASQALGRYLDGAAHCSPVNGRSQWIGRSGRCGAGAGAGDGVVALMHCAAGMGGTGGGTILRTR